MRVTPPQATDALLARLADHAQELFDAENHDLITALSRLGEVAVDQGDAHAVLLSWLRSLDAGHYRQQWETRFTPLLGDAAIDGRRALGRVIGRTFRSTAELADRAAQQAAQLAAQVTTTTAGRVVQTYHAIQQGGGTAADLASALREGPLSLTDVAWRSTLVGDLEGTTAYAMGVMDAAEEGGFLSKTWLHGDPAEPREDHEAADGETIPLDEVFSTGLDYPYAPDADIQDTAGCTCWMELSTDPPDDAEDSGA